MKIHPEATRYILGTIAGKGGDEICFSCDSSVAIRCESSSIYLKKENVQFKTNSVLKEMDDDFRIYDNNLTVLNMFDFADLAIWNAINGGTGGIGITGPTRRQRVSEPDNEWNRRFNHRLQYRCHPYSFELRSSKYFLWSKSRKKFDLRFSRT